MLKKTLIVAAAFFGVQFLAFAGDESVHDFNFTSIDGTEMSMADFAGHPVLLVNTASKCGFTPQYEGLQALWESHREKGLIIVGVPSGDFRGQEFDDSGKIKQFCEVNYGVNFPLTDKYHVIGDEAHPLYKWLETKLGAESIPKWNFHKYLISADGKAVTFFPTTTKPRDPSIMAAIEAELALN